MSKTKKPNDINLTTIAQESNAFPEKRNKLSKQEQLLVEIEGLKINQVVLQQEILKLKRALLYLKKLVDENHKQ